MAQIEISNLNPVGSDLFASPDSFLTELQATDANQVVGGRGCGGGRGGNSGGGRGGYGGGSSNGGGYNLFCPSVPVYTGCGY